MAAKVLIVEDNDGISVVLQKMVRAMGLEAIAVKDGLSAIDLANELQPDLMLLDVMIPHRSGFEVCQAVKGNPKTAHIKVFMLTGTTFGHAQGDESWKEKVGADGFFSKPIPRDVLVKAVSEALSLKITL